MSDLETALSKRQQHPLTKTLEAYRVFHGPTESRGPLQNYAVDRYGDHAWITHWGTPEGISSELSEFVKKKFSSAAVIHRPPTEIPEPSQIIWGTPPDFFWIKEGKSEFKIILKDVRHPGLFLDHRNLRLWLQDQKRFKSVLNGFAYTGSLTVAASHGGARDLTTVDLSSATLKWAQQNIQRNSPESQSKIIAEDYFEFVRRAKKRKQFFDLVLVDPPSFSRAPTGVFSTQKDLEKLLIESAAVVAPQGVLMVSINSATLPRKEFEKRAKVALKSRPSQTLFKIELDFDFPVDLQNAESDYLKGLVLKFD